MRLRGFILTTLGYLIGFGALLTLAPTLLTFLLAVLLAMAVHDVRSRRRRHAESALNAAIRAVSEFDGGIDKVVTAFARSGPVKHPCRQYAQRLSVGEDPLLAAAASGVPLELSTAISLRLPERRQADNPNRLRDDLSIFDTNRMPVYGQFVYLIGTALITFLVFQYMRLKISPMIEMMLDEFGLRRPSKGWLGIESASVGLLLSLLLVAVVIAPMMNRGILLGRSVSRCMPLLPGLARRKSTILQGLADAIDSGMPLDQAIEIGLGTSTRSHAASEMRRVLSRIQKGLPAAVAFQQVGWINAKQAGWLQDASPSRTTQLLRTIADQNLRDAEANSRWIMGIFFPIVILTLGCLVLGYAYRFFYALSELIYGLA